MGKLFTKSAFKVALTCPAQLYYYYDGNSYANQNADDEFLKSLAEGGFQVGELAKVYYDVPESNDLSGMVGYDEPLRRTAALMSSGDVTIAEAAFRHGNLFVRADIVQKRVHRIDLIEVKAKSWESGRPFVKENRSHVEVVDGEIAEYVYDVAFQKYVLQHAFPELDVHAYLMMADKTKTADVAGINQCFRIMKHEGRTHVLRCGDYAELREREHVLTAFDVDDVCERIISGRIGEQNKLLGEMSFEAFIEEMSKRYCNHDQRYCEVSTRCFGCPFYKTKDSPQQMLDGYEECWMHKAGFKKEDFNRPLLEDLWGGMGGDFRSKLLEQKKYFLSDLSASDFRMRPLDKPGLTPDERRLVQIALMTDRSDILTDRLRDGITESGVYIDLIGLKNEMDTWRYPLHMIDFETSSVALPFYEGMRPYEQIAFQFSHHVISKNSDGSYSIEHAGQFINMKRGRFPNFEFIRELKSNLDNDDGTIFRYSHHENSILNAIRVQLQESTEPDKLELIDFIEQITHRDEKTQDGWIKIRGPRDMVDLCDVVRQYYYHPSMKGSNSIKVVLPAILNSSKLIQEKYSKPIYGGDAGIKSLNILSPEAPRVWVTMEPDENGDMVAVNPYKKLPKVAEYFPLEPEKVQSYITHQDENLESINNGGAALSAYGLIQFCDEDSERAKALESALLRYCELDTLAMVFIWEYFNEVTQGEKQ